MILSPPLSSAPTLLPTTVMERYLARPSHGSGMVFSITLVLEGSVEMELLRRAWFTTVQQHPRMFARLVGSGRRQRWELQQHADDDSFVYRVLAHNTPADVNDAASVCPRLGVAMKCVIQSVDQQRWSIRLLFHHACCDGVGAIRMIGQLFKTYVNADRRLRPSGAPDTPSASSRAQPEPQTKSVSPAQLPDLKNLWTTIRGKNVRLSQRDAMGETDCPAPTNTTIATFQDNSRLMFSLSQSDQIRGLLRSRKITLNDWAIAVTLHTLASLCASRASQGNHVMIMNPVEMRTWAQRHDASNHIGIAFVRRTHGQLRDIQQTLTSVSEQMANVRQYGTARELAGGIAIAERIPGCLDLVERWGTFTPTAALTSVAGLRLGKRMGVHRQNGALCIADAKLVDVFFEGPIQFGGQVSTTIWEFEGQIAISNRTAPGVLDPAAKRRLLALWARLASESLALVDLAPAQCDVDL